MGINSLASETFFEITDIVFFFLFWNCHHHTTANASTPTLRQPTTHTNTTKHNQTQRNTNTSHISSTDTGPIHSKWLEACTVMPGQSFRAWCEHVRPTRNGPRKALALWHSGQVRAMCTESQLDERSLSLSLRERRKKSIAHNNPCWTCMARTRRWRATYISQARACLALRCGGGALPLLLPGGGAFTSCEFKS